MFPPRGFEESSALDDSNFGGLIGCDSAALYAPSGVFIRRDFLLENVLNLQYLGPKKRSLMDHFDL